MKLAAIYARYSSERQTEQSIEGQLDVCKKYAEQNGLQIIDTYIDRAMTGTNDNRAAFQQMLSDSAKAAWEIVLVYALDRFRRNSIEMALNKKKLIDNGKILISATQKTSTNIDGTKNLDGIMLENIYTGVAEYYSAELSQKIRRGQNESRKKGQFCGGGLPDGFIVDKNKHIQIQEERAEIIRFIYEQYSLGVVVSKIIQQLNENGIMNGDGKPFIANAVYNILKNEKYAGIYRTKSGEVYDNIYPRIVSRKIYEKVRSITEKNKIGTRSVVTVYLLRHKVRCGYCGCPISAEGGTAKNGSKKHYYACRGRKKLHNSCTKKAIRKDALENLVLDTVINSLSKPKLMNEMIARLIEQQKRQAGENDLLKMMKREKQKIENAIYNLITALENGISSSSTNKRLHELESRKEELERSIMIEQSKSAVLLTEDEIKGYYVDALKQEPLILIGTLIKQIRLYDDKIHIELNSPTTQSPDESQGFLLCTEIKEIAVANTCSPMYVNVAITAEIVIG